MRTHLSFSPSAIETLETRLAPATLTFNLSNLTTGSGFHLNGEVIDDQSGFAISGAGDLNGDGLDDLILATPIGSQNGANSGTIYVVFGQTSFSSSFDLSSLNGTNGFRIFGQQSGDSTGFSVSGAGDLNDDGFADLIIGAPNVSVSGTNPGAAYVIFGQSTFGASVDLSTLNGTTGFVLLGESDGDSVGRSVGGAGDLNGDGFDDLFIGAPYAAANGFNSGAVYVVFGGSLFSSTIDLSSLNGTTGFKLKGEFADDNAGYSVSNAGDLNGDSFDDLILGAPGVDNGGQIEAGAAYLLFGASSFGSVIELSSLDGQNGFKLSGKTGFDAAGTSVANAGDLNDDGLTDLVIGAPGSDSNGSDAGSAYVFFGQANGFSSNFQLSTLDGSNGFRLVGTAINQNTGSSVSGAGDFNGDGIDDLLIGAPSADGLAGRTYLLYGNSEGFASSLNLSTLDGSSGFALLGTGPNQLSGSSVRAAGDLNGDGFDDLFINAPSLSGFASSFVVFGTPIKIAADHRSASYLDLDGDTVTLKVSTGSLELSSFHFYTNPAGIDGGVQLAELDLSPLGFTNAAVTLSARLGLNGGDGLVNLGFLNASGHNLGAVTISGDLGRIEAGTSGNALASLSVLSMGMLGLTTQTGLASASLSSSLIGALPTFKVGSNLAGITFNSSGTMKTVTINGSVLSSSLTTDANFSSISVTGSIDNSLLTATGAISKLTVGGPVSESSFSASGENPDQSPVVGKTIGTITVKGSLLDTMVNAGSGNNPAANVNTIKINGQIQASEFTISGALGTFSSGHSITDSSLLVGGTLAKATVVGNFDNTLLSALGQRLDSQSSTFTIGSLTIKGSLLRSSQLLCGYDDLGDEFTTLPIRWSSLNISGSVNDSTIASPGIIKSTTIGADFINSTINLAGPATESETTLSTGAITIKGSMTDSANIQVGYDFTGVATNFNVLMNNIVINGALIDSAIRSTGTAKEIRIGGDVENSILNVQFRNQVLLGPTTALSAIKLGGHLSEHSSIVIGFSSLVTKASTISVASDWIDCDLAAGQVQTFSVGGSLTDSDLVFLGSVNSFKVAGTLSKSLVAVNNTLGTLSVGVDLDQSTVRVLGNSSTTKTISTLNVTGQVVKTSILAGYNVLGTASNAGAQIGKVSVGSAWIESNLIAGIEAGTDMVFGTSDDAPIGVSLNNLPSKIASIIVKGPVLGTSASGDQFIIEALEIGSFKLGATVYPFTVDLESPGFQIAPTFDVVIREVEPA